MKKSVFLFSLVFWGVYSCFGMESSTRAIGEKSQEDIFFERVQKSFYRGAEKDLYEAVEKGDLESVKHFCTLFSGYSDEADIIIGAFRHAIAAGKLTIIKYFMEEKEETFLLDPVRQDIMSMGEAVDLAAKNNHWEVLNYLLESGNLLDLFSSDFIDSMMVSLGGFNFFKKLYKKDSSLVDAYFGSAGRSGIENIFWKAVSHGNHLFINYLIKKEPTGVYDVLKPYREKILKF